MKITEAKKGDCCYFLTRNSTTPMFGEIYQVSVDESILFIIEQLNSKYYVVHSQNASWDKKELKLKKWVDPYNYKQTSEIINEEKPIKRSGNVHNRKKTRNSNKRKPSKSKSPS
tara:strand:- start:401 stop:742 length:342 start_codon:yes stop_codon:yes gene_type:complete